MCFKHSVARSLNIEDRHNTRLTPLLREKIAQLDWTGVEFPTPLEGESIRNFEKNNNIGVAIYTSEENEEGENVVIRKRSPGKRFGKVANIFFMSVPNGSEVTYHFCAISRLSALIRGKGRQEGASYCSYCSARFYNKYVRASKKGDKKKKRVGITRTHEELCAEHEEVCQVITGEIFTPREKLPKPDENILSFRKWSHLFKSPPRIYTDLECAHVDHYETNGEGTMTYHDHQPMACSKRYVSEVPNLQFGSFNYQGPDAHKRLVKELKRVTVEIDRIPYFFARYDEEEMKRFNKATSCVACGGEFVPNDKKLRKVFDHSHWTGEYRSAMHSRCNLQCRKEREFPVFFHNLSKYDGNFLIRALNTFDDGKVTVLPRNEETYFYHKGVC